MHWIRSEIERPEANYGLRASARTAAMEDQAGISDDLRLFATTFAAGFLFVFLIIA